MRSSLSLQRSLFAHQRRQIEKQLQGVSPAFRKYEQRYLDATKRFSRRLSLGEVHDRVRDRDLVYVGDYHTLRQAQSTFLEIARAAVESGRPVVLGLEFVERRFQPVVDEYLSGALTDTAFLEQIGHPYVGPFDIWPGFKPIFSFARQKKLEIIALDSRPRARNTLLARDKVAAKVLARRSQAADRPLILVLVGQFHIAPKHLPAQVDGLLPKGARRRLIVYQNAERLWWKLLAQGGPGDTPAVEVSASEVCVFSASPVACQGSFLDYVNAEAGDASIEEAALTDTVLHLAKSMARAVGVPLPLRRRQVLVLGLGQVSAIEQLLARSKTSRQEAGAIRRTLHSKQSAYLPTEGIVWLAGRSLNHASAAATQLVRHHALGRTLVKRRASDRFWRACLEESLTFLGTRLLNPARGVTSVERWVEHFQTGDEELRRAAAFVLAAWSPDEEHGALRVGVLPRESDPLFETVTAGVGALLGGALADALLKLDLPSTTLRRLFTDPFENPRASFRALRASVTTRRTETQEA
jgi:hypothetical protein